jgi:hypothetical protein
MKTFSKRASAVLGTAVVATLSAGIAGAVWTSPTGSGNSSATGYTAVAANITAQSTNDNSAAAKSLYPGASVTNTVTITNPNPYPIVVTDITQGAGNSASGSCAAGTVNFATRTNSSGLPQSGGTTTAIAANGGTGTYDVVVTMASTADNACQGLTFTLPATVASKSANF